MRPVSGSNAPPPHPAPPIEPGMTTVPLVDGGVNNGPVTYGASASRARALISGVKSMTSSGPNPCLANGAGLLGIGWVGDEASPGTSLRPTGRSKIGQIETPVTRSKTKRKPVLVGTAT